ncbi:hypothetical protein [Micavibrio aeruginosavorus]|uniref:Putative membrane protein n=1 Tax=Micavibrio aeruginosavorus (strain ARL-13) TaxID=856793 RepID=G2KN15_MICAA|nr:hypothetical protein [Micavibrio aeruginosavorus]AEP08947.1 putative membrane protein [Micavibrio aeruginosavorus ARL-13]
MDDIAIDKNRNLRLSLLAFFGPFLVLLCDGMFASVFKFSLLFNGLEKVGVSDGSLLILCFVPSVIAVFRMEIGLAMKLAGLLLGGLVISPFLFVAVLMAGCLFGGRCF